MHCHTLVLSIQHFFRTRISHTPLTIQHPKLECGCTLWNEFLVRNPCLCPRLVDFTTVLFFRGVDQLLFSQSCSFCPDNGLNIFCCELTSTVQTFGSFNYNGELRWWCLFNESQALNSLYAPFSFLSNSDQHIHVNVF